MKLHLRRCVVCVAVFHSYSTGSGVSVHRWRPHRRKNLPIQRLSAVPAVQSGFQDEAGHFAAAHLGIDHHGGGLSVLQCIKFGSNDLDFPAYLVPMEQVFHFATGQIDQNTALLADSFDEVVGQNRFPIVELRLVLVLRQADIPLHPVVLDGIQWTQ